MGGETRPSHRAKVAIGTSPFRCAARPHLEAAVSRPAVVALLPSCRASASCRSPLRSPPSAAKACAPFRLAAPVAITPECLSAILLPRDHSVCRPPAGRPANPSPRDAPTSLARSSCRTVLPCAPLAPPDPRLSPAHFTLGLGAGSLAARLVLIGEFEGPALLAPPPASLQAVPATCHPPDLPRWLGRASGLHLPTPPGDTDTAPACLIPGHAPSDCWSASMGI